MPSKRPQLVVLCTDLPSIRAITESVGKYFELDWSRDLNGLMNSVKQEPAPVAVIIDNAVPQFPAIKTLESIRSSGAKSRRILITDHCDLGMIVQGLHTGAIERIVYKPIYAPELLSAIGSENLPASVITPPATQTRTNQSRVVG